jgi:ZIP family zinc transporter
MLPSSKKYLTAGGMSKREATFTMIGCFLLGALCISILSNIMHRFIPHSVVDCDHEHGDEEEGKLDGDDDGDDDAEPARPTHDHDHHHAEHADGHRSYGTTSDSPPRRPSLHTAISSRVSQLVTGKKKICDKNGQCHGYSETCGAECFRNVQQRLRPKSLHHRPSVPLLQEVDETTPLVSSTSGPATTATTPTESSHPPPPPLVQKHSHASLASRASAHSAHSAQSHAHHHHVPTNAFLSLGLQTSTAIALHKIPEGFITYATNHANPTLGLSIFLALFIHNITEGFALALPLYLALNSRWKAMLVSAVLGGVSQPLGAGVAAAWFKLAGRRKGGMGGSEDKVYGCMFAATAGIMAMVSLQLLAESLDLTHSRRLCFISAFAGMGVLGLSAALTA